MEATNPLSLGMFWGGLLVAAVPILFTIGVGLYALRRHRSTRRESLRKEVAESR